MSPSKPPSLAPSHSSGRPSTCGPLTPTGPYMSRETSYMSDLPSSPLSPMSMSNLSHISHVSRCPTILSRAGSTYSRSTSSGHASGPKPAQPQYRNIVVVGASVAGHNFVNSLAPLLPPNYRILLIERNEFVLHAAMVVRAIVNPGWEEKPFTAQITQETIFPAVTRHRVISPNTVIELRRHSLVLLKAFEGSTEVFFEKCIIATGANQPLPIRPVAGSSLDGWKANLRQTQADIAAARSILIVGGGTVGIEVAGEISDLYPDKKVSIVHWDVGLLHPSDSGGNTAHTYVAPRTSLKLSQALHKQLTARGVDCILCDRVDFRGAWQWGGRPGSLGEMREIPLVSGRTVMADYVFDSTGNRPNSHLVRDADPSALTTNGYISIDEYFRIRSSPEGPLGSDYYSIGDCANAPNWKSGVAAAVEGRALARIVAATLRGQRPHRYRPPNAVKESVVLLGSNGGAGVLRVPILGTIKAPDFVIDKKATDFWAGKNFFARFRGARPVLHNPAAFGLSASGKMSTLSVVSSMTSMTTSSRSTYVPPIPSVPTHPFLAASAKASQVSVTAN